MLTASPRKQYGATLIEVLVTLVVLAIGLLGMAGLQTMSIKSNQSAYYRSQASFLAYDITERMRANRKAAQDGDYDVNFPASSKANAVSGTRAKQDLAEWLNSLADKLPNGTGKISREISPENTLVTLEVRWDDSRGAIQASDNDKKSIETFVYWTEI